tara:strand:- start:34182 stop:35528 length:1347 start_codon:yes stop_codon:yes gene_type:complete
MKNKPLVTVYITNHNYGKFVKNAIDSVLSQTFKNFELIIIDDGSTDKSKQIIKKYKNDKRITTIFQKNKGLTTSNNLALRISKGKYIMRLDADDWLDSNAIQILANKLENNPKLGLVFPDYYEVDERGNFLNLVRRHDFKKVKLLNQPAHGACTMIRKVCLNQIGGYNERFDRQDGVYLWIKFIKKYEIANVNLPLFFYRQHISSLTRNEEKILKTRSEIIESENINKSSHRMALAVIPIRGLSINPNSLVLKKLKKKPLVCWIIDVLIKSKKISKILISSPDTKILKYLKKKYKRKIVTQKRDAELGGINVEINETLKKAIIFSKKKGFNFDYVFQFSYKTPFLKSNDIDSFVNMMNIYKTDEVVGVRSEVGRIYKHTGSGLNLLNKNSNLKLERDELYRGVEGIRIFKKNFFSKKNKKNIIGHYILDQKSSHAINSELDWKIAQKI